MGNKKRPGGLTVMAIYNFFLAFSGLIGSLYLIPLFFTDITTNDHIPEVTKSMFEAFKEKPSILMTYIVMQITFILLSALSGIGYLDQKRFLGRILGNIYAILSIIGTFVWHMIATKEIIRTVSLLTYVGLVYPFLTLILLNTTFKNDLTN